MKRFLCLLSLFALSASADDALRLSMPREHPEAFGSRKQQCCARAPEDMIAWWPFDETLGGVAFDIAGSADDNGLHNGPVLKLPGKVAGAACYDGLSAFTRVANGAEVDFPNSCFVDAGTSFTIDFWIWTDAVSGTYSIVDKREFDGVSTLRGYHVYLHNGQIGFQVAGGTGSLFCSPNGPVCTNFTSPFTVAGTGQWHFVAITVVQSCRSSSGTFYVDGQQSTFTPTSVNLGNNADLYIGRRMPNLGTGFFRGCLDEVEYFRPALSKADLDEIYAAGPIGKCKPKPRSS